MFGLDPSVVHRDDAVGQNAIDVRDQQLDRLAPRGQVGRRFRVHDGSLLEIGGNEPDQIGHIDQADQVVAVVDDRQLADFVGLHQLDRLGQRGADADGIGIGAS